MHLGDRAEVWDQLRHKEEEVLGAGWSLRSQLEEEEYRLWESAFGVGRSRKSLQGGGWNRALKEEVATRRKDAQVTWEMHWIISIGLCCVGWKQ